MCGICGIARAPGQEFSRATLVAMTAALAHRGPDGDGIFVDRHVGLGHRRLSIIDLAGGAQPIFNEDGTIAVVLNGEIFNYRELTEELVARGHVFTTRSDTETLVHLYEEDGIGMVAKLRGMFAFAIADRRTDAIYLVRDRFGIKPLYYHERHGTLIFASEIAALIAGGYSVDVNRRGVHQYLLTRFAYGDETIFKGVHRLPEGTWLEWRGGRAVEHRYYPVATAASPELVNGDFDERFAAEFSDAVRAWMIADVPVGAYLSGGVDSSMIVSEMSRLTSHSVRTFCVDFEGSNSEAAQAEQTAKRLGCEHQTLTCGVDELLALPAIVRTLEEPVGDGIVVPQYFLPRATRQAGIKTVLTGDGADETLGGYQHLRAIAEVLKWTRRLPGFGAVGSAVARHLPLPIVEALAGLPFDVARHARTRLASVLRLAADGDMRALYDELMALHQPSELREVYTDAFLAEVAGFPRETLAGDPSGSTLVAQVLSMQFRRWLPAINLKQDRLCMAHGVENRVPYLDHHLVELIAAAPDREKIHGRATKVALRRLAARQLPASVASAPKAQFHLPLVRYLREPRLWAMIDDNLDDRRVRCRGFVRPEYVRSVKARARSGDFLAAKQMLALVILELWHRIFVDRESLE